MYEQYMNQFNPGGYFPQPFSQPVWSYQRAMPQGITNVRFVNGLSEAQNCTTPLGKTLLMDKEKLIFYIKETDFNNVSTVKAYSFQEYQPETDSAGQSNYITREEFDKWKEQYESSIRPSTTASSAANGSASTIHENNDSTTGESASGADVTERFSF